MCNYKLIILKAILFILVLSNMAMAQQLKIIVIDKQSEERLVGAGVSFNNKTFVSDFDGNIFIDNPLPQNNIEVKYLGYLNYADTVSLEEIKNNFQIKLQKSDKRLEEVVISAGRYEQKIGKVPVAIEIIKPTLIENKNTFNLETVLQQVPGLNVIDGQVSIRGGSGFSYGAGSRVMLLIDDMPLLAGDASDIKFNFLPVENIEQIEVLKGASSALYGSSALNGVINLRTAYAKETPETKVIISQGIYDNPLRNATKWWKTANPGFNTMSINHSRKIKNLDLVLGANYFNDEGYREGEKEQRLRFNFNTRYRFKNIKGLSVGINGSGMTSKGGLFVLWLDKDSGALRPLPGTLSNFTSIRANIDPHVTWYAPNGDKHILRSRFFYTDNQNDTRQSATSLVNYNEYLYQKSFTPNTKLNAGLVYITNKIWSDSLYGNHSGMNTAAFLQLDHDWRKFSFSFGARGEYFSLNKEENISEFKVQAGNTELIKSNTKIRPVFRFGSTYQALEYTFLRFSIGQGYRYPSVAEKFVATSVGGLTVFPNTQLMPETGYNIELGIKQGFKISNFMGFFDLSAFYSEYQNTIEYNFGYYVPDSIKTPTIVQKIQYAGFRSLNVGNTMIRGIDASLNGSGKIGKFNFTTLTGYTLVDAQSLNNDSAYIFSGTDSSRILKYRNRHSFKTDLQIDYKNFSIGVSIRYLSFMQNIDRAFQEPILSDLIPGFNSGIYIVNGLKEYRAIHNTGKTITDLRASWEFKKGQRVAFVVNNVFNVEMMGRPADLQPMRNFAVQYMMKL